MLAGLSAYSPCHTFTHVTAAVLVAAPCGSAVRTRVPRPAGFGLLPQPMGPAGSPLRKLLPLATRLKSAATWEQRTFATLRAVCPE